MDTAWYFRLFYVHILSVVISSLLSVIIRAKRMGTPTGRSWVIVFWTWISLIIGWVLMWFVPFSINLAFWIGLGIIVFGQMVYGLGYSAMREHPEKSKVVVDWGVYKISRHSHILASIICLLGTVVMGWNIKSTIYIILWIYFALYVIGAHFYVLSEEKVNVEKFGQEYEDYIKRVPRYFLIK